MRWLVEVRGDTNDLAALADAFANTPKQVTQVDDNWYIAGQAVENAATATEAHAEAERWLPTLNGLGRAQIVGFTPITLTDRVFDPDNTEHGTTILGEAHLTARATLTVGNSPGSGIRALDGRLASDPALREAIRILGKSDKLEWMDLYKIYEVLLHAAGSQDALRQRVGITKREASAFTYSANSPRASGDQARHAADKFQSSNTPPMSLDEARAFIRRVLASW